MEHTKPSRPILHLPANKKRPYESVTFGNDAHQAVVHGVLQRPTFNSPGAAKAFAKAVHEGRRKGEPVRDK